MDVCVCVLACVRACVHACMRVCVHACVRACDVYVVSITHIFLLIFKIDFSN